MRIVLGLCTAAVMAFLMVLRFYGDAAAGAPSLPGVCVGCDLARTDLHDASLRGVRWTGADLHGANLQHADLRDALLQGADLRNADLRGADLRGARFEGADLRGTLLEGARMDDTHFEGADFSGQNLTTLATNTLRMLLSGCAGCDFRDVDLHGASLSQLTLAGDDFHNANMRNVSFAGSRIVSDAFHDADLEGADLTRALVCSRSTITNMFQRQLGQMACAGLTGANLRGANFQGAQMCDPDINSTRPDAYINCRQVDAATLQEYGGADLTGARGL